MRGEVDSPCQTLSDPWPRPRGERLRFWHPACPSPSSFVSPFSPFLERSSSAALRGAARTWASPQQQPAGSSPQAAAAAARRQQASYMSQNGGGTERVKATKKHNREQPKKPKKAHGSTWIDFTRAALSQRQPEAEGACKVLARRLRSAKAWRAGLWLGPASAA